jgi:hypothetical protein
MQDFKQVTYCLGEQRGNFLEWRQQLSGGAGSWVYWADTH